MRKTTPLLLVLLLMLGVLASSTRYQQSTKASSGHKFDEHIRESPLFFFEDKIQILATKTNDQQDRLNQQNPLWEDIETAIYAVDGFWKTHWNEYFNVPYWPPRLEPYYGNNNPKCGGIYSPMAENAYYCGPNNYIAWDMNFLSSMYEDPRLGDASIYLVIAHEWGHAVQYQVYGSLSSSVETELQADCLAGAALRGAINDGVLIEEPGDQDEIFNNLVRVADKWGNPRSHGSARERNLAFQTGENGGVPACF